MEEIKTNKAVALAYELSVEMDGEETIVEECTDERPFRFVTGLGFTFDAFEQAIAPLAKGDEFDFVIPKEEANGERDENYVFDVNKSIFVVDGKFQSDEIYPGNIVPLMDADGNRIQAQIVAVGKDTVTVDLNHPLAGRDLHFTGHVVEMRDATPEEISGMLKLITGEGCGHCSGHCDSCDHDCGGNEGCEGGCGGCK